MWAEWIVRVAALYVILGIGFAVVFLIRGVAAMDPAAKHSGWAFRAMIFPGVAAMWPVLAKRWLRRAAPVTH